MTRAAATEASMLRRVRLRLLAWSGGTTLVVVVLLGAAIYAAVAASLAAGSEEQLRSRGLLMVGGVPVIATGTGEVSGGGVVVRPEAPGILFGGSGSGTIGFVVDPSNEVVPDVGPLPVAGLPTIEGVVDARTGMEAVETTTVGGTPIRVLSIPVTTPQGTFVVQVVADMTAEKRTLAMLLLVLSVGGLLAVAAALGAGWVYAERAIVPVRVALRRQREFAADASHELRTPLAVIKGAVEDMRRREGRVEPATDEALDDIDLEVDRMTTLVDDLLLLARTDSGAIELQKAPTDLAEIALEACDGLAPLADGRAVGIEVDAEPAPLTGDPERLRQLVRILVDNALRHAPPGSVVTVRARSIDRAAVLTVDDVGPGFSPDDLPRVFDRFWRAPGEPPGGTGLGLAIAAWIVERHGGGIAASNRPDGGARIEARIPSG